MESLEIIESRLLLEAIYKCYGYDFRSYTLDGMQSRLQSIVKRENLQSISCMPLFVKPDRKLSVRDVQNMMRDHYEGTELDPTKDVSAGAFHSPYRVSALLYKVDGKEMFSERPIATQQSAYTLVAQMRSHLPNAVGGILWFGLDDSNMTVFTPVYCCSDRVPECYLPKYATSDKFS